MDPDPKDLWEMIKKGDQSDKVCAELEKFKDKKHISEYRPSKNKDSFLHLVARFHTTDTVLRKLIKMCPEMVLYKRSGEYEGQTALHLLITKNNLAGLEAFFECLNELGEINMELSNKIPYQPLCTPAVGSSFEGTPMMAQLPFSVAVLTFNKNMVDFLWKQRIDVTLGNELGDTCFHSLVRYAKAKPEMLENVKEMMYHLYAKFLTDFPDSRKMTEMFLQENNQKMTALKLAVSLGQNELFSLLLYLKHIYSEKTDNDGMCDEYEYDITEIDPLAQDEFIRMKNMGSLDETSQSTPAFGDTLPETTAIKPSTPAFHQNFWPKLWRSLQGDRKNRYGLSVLELICLLKFKQAFPFIDKTGVVRYVIDKKWEKYKVPLGIWALLHVLFLVFLGLCGFFRSECIRSTNFEDHDQSNECRQRKNESLSPQCNTAEKAAGYVSCVLDIVYGMILIFMEFNRCFYFKQKLYVSRLSHNGIYRVIFCIFALFLIMDAVWFLSSRDNNYSLIVALLFGSWLCTFFLRGVKLLSFFCYMFLKVLFQDLMRLIVFLLIQWLSFSSAMYLLFLTTDKQPDAFSTFGKGMLVMFKIMLGLDDIPCLSTSALAYILYFIFVLLTYVLLFNSLIALISTTCSAVSEDRKGLWALQRLSVIIHVESMLFPNYRFTTGTWKPIELLDPKTRHVEKLFRCKAKVKSVAQRPIDAESVLEAEEKIKIQRKSGNINYNTQLHSLLKNINQVNFAGPSKPGKSKRKKTQDVDISNISVRRWVDTRPKHDIVMPIPHPFVVQEAGERSLFDTTQELLHGSTLSKNQQSRP